MKKRRTNKLGLDRETLRRLETERLEKANGGTLYNTWFCQPTLSFTFNGCPTMDWKCVTW